MAKYKITVLSSKQQYWSVKTFVLLCLLSVWLWPTLWPTLWPWQWLIQLSLSVVVIYYGLLTPFKADTERHFVLSETGEVYLVIEAGQEPKPFELSPGSVTCDWFCYLVLNPKGVMATKQKQRFWVFRDAVDETQYRRICRTIHRVRRG